jgi:hypothetical protein
MTVVAGFLFASRRGGPFKSPSRATGADVVPGSAGCLFAVPVPDRDDRKGENMAKRKPAKKSARKAKKAAPARRPAAKAKKAAPKKAAPKRHPRGASDHSEEE